MLKVHFLNCTGLCSLIESPTYMCTHTHMHTLLTPFIIHQKALVAPSPSTPEIKHVGILWKLSCKFLQNRCVIPIHATCQLCELRVRIRYSPLLLFCSGLKQLSEINFIHAIVPKRIARFSWQMQKISCCHRIPQCLLSTRCQRMQIYSWVWCSFVLLIPSLPAVVFHFHFHVHRVEFSEVGDRHLWLPVLIWIYIFVYLENIFLSWIVVYLCGYIWVCLPITIENNLTHKHYLFSVSSLNWSWLSK